MNMKKFSEAISQVNDKYYEEAANYECKQKKHGWVKWSAMAACFAVIVFTAFSIISSCLNQWGVPPSDNSGGNIANNPNDDTTTSEIHISMENIFFNEITEFSDATRKYYYDPELYDDIVWDKEAIISYYGKDLTPAYIPNGLFASLKNGTAMVIVDNKGDIVMDTVGLNFYHEYYEDGSSKLTEDIAAYKGISITASKIGLLNDCYYIMSENEVITSDLAGTSVTFGYRSLPYGPYDPDTHEPSGYYDMYVAEFEQDGIEYQIIAEQMEADELVKVVSSVICGEKVIIDQ